MAAYQRIIDDYYNGDYVGYTLEGTSGGFALTPEANETVDSTEFERDYLTAFALYRVIQLTLYLNEYSANQNAEDRLARMYTEFPLGERGYRYTAMAQALYDEYAASGNMNAACNAAEEAFNTMRDTDADPAIPYFINDDGQGDTWKFPFYWNSGKAYSADPDNVFDVPEHIANIIFIPVCVE